MLNFQSLAIPVYISTFDRIYICPSAQALSSSSSSLTAIYSSLCVAVHSLYQRSHLSCSLILIHVLARLLYFSFSLFFLLLSLFLFLSQLLLLRIIMTWCLIYLLDFSLLFAAVFLSLANTHLI